jgi:hypothetical protein
VDRFADRSPGIPVAANAVRAMARRSAVLLPALVSCWKQEGVIVKNAGSIILSAYITILMAALILGPLVILKGYRAWWLVAFYAVLAVATIGGTIGHYGNGRRNEHA